MFFQREAQVTSALRIPQHIGFQPFSERLNARDLKQPGEDFQVEDSPFEANTRANKGRTFTAV